MSDFIGSSLGFGNSFLASVGGNGRVSIDMEYF